MKVDKVGAILIIDPKILEISVQEILENPNVHIKLDNDPTESLCDEFFKCWVHGKKKFVTATDDNHFGTRFRTRFKIRENLETKSNYAT